MNEPETDRIATALAGSAGASASSTHIAERVLDSFAGVEQALVPIIGQRGAAALYKRALHLTRWTTHPWLPTVAEAVPSAADLSSLRAALLLQSPADAARGGAALLSNYHELLASLVGRPLTERLLRSVWVAFLADPSPQKPLP